MKNKMSNYKEWREAGKGKGRKERAKKGDAMRDICRPAPLSSALMLYKSPSTILCPLHV